MVNLSATERNQIRLIPTYWIVMGKFEKQQIKEIILFLNKCLLNYCLLESLVALDCAHL